MRAEFILLVFMIGFVSAGVQICIDLDAPSAPGNLNVSGSVGSILVSWDAAVDEPACSGIDYYNVSRNGEWIGQTDGLSFIDVDDLAEGNYNYTVYAVDLVGGNAGASVKNEVVVSSGGKVSSSSGSSSYKCTPEWECGNWSDCVGGDMRRVCEDLRRCGTTYLKPETYFECGTVDDYEDELEESVVLESSAADVNERDSLFSSIIGAVIGGGTGSLVGAGVLLVFSVLGLVLVIRKRGV